MPKIKINNRYIGDDEPVYFIADIGANHDGSLERALMLIRLAAEAGADAVKFQHFRAEHIVSQRGFEDLPPMGHQSKWTKPVYDVYKDAEIPWSWTDALAWQCKMSGVDFLSTPYDLEAVDHLDPYVPAFKIGSGDITYHELLEKVASKGKPVILATGAATHREVENAVLAVKGADLVLMQCNTNYEAGLDRLPNLSHHNLRTLTVWGHLVTVAGLSDHTVTPSVVHAAVALGVKVIERHFTDNPESWKGPDHHFAMSPDGWRYMVASVRQLEPALGDGIKRVETNEQETVIIQRRALRAASRIAEGLPILREDVTVLRPCPAGALGADKLSEIVGRVPKRDIEPGQLVTWEDLT